MPVTETEVDMLKQRVELKEKELLKRYPDAFYGEIQQRSTELKELRAELTRKERALGTRSAVAK
jgi:hypothetical protein